ncbi:GGDEF domain-containing protein [Geomonas silvestris]|nr:GGDEF domain-containing protein [Geomonas silvestris]
MKDPAGKDAVRKELLHFERVLQDAALADNILLPHMQRLLVLARNLECHCERLAKKNQQLESHLTDYTSYLNQASRIDLLTRLPNRRDLSERLVREDSRSQRHWRTFSLILVNLDDFSQINEIHGFNAGDELLVEVACQLQGFVRSEDVCGRWSGDEFLIILAETGMEGALIVAEKVVKSIAMTEFRVDRPGLRTTVSAALGNFRPDQGMHEFLAALDRGVQQAKREGKNRCVII